MKTKTKVFNGKVDRSRPKTYLHISAVRKTSKVSGVHLEDVELVIRTYLKVVQSAAVDGRRVLIPGVCSITNTLKPAKIVHLFGNVKGDGGAHHYDKATKVCLLPIRKIPKLAIDDEFRKMCINAAAERGETPRYEFDWVDATPENKKKVLDQYYRSMKKEYTKKKPVTEHT